MASYFRQQLENWLKTIDIIADRVLDVGGGANPIKGRTKTWKVKEYKIFDNELEKAKSKPDYKGDLNIEITLNPIIQKICWEDGFFDIIFCLEVMEYIWDPRTAVKNLWLMLKECGILYISFPFIYPIHEPKEYDYLRYTYFGIVKLLESAGFKKWEIWPRIEDGNIKIRDWFASEKMHLAKDFNHSIIGYLVKAIK